MRFGNGLKNVKFFIKTSLVFIKTTIFLLPFFKADINLNYRDLKYFEAIQ